MRYVIRIQLNHAESVDYASLHAAMEKINFFKYIRGHAGNWYHLTTAMYYGSANRTAGQIQSYLHDLIVQLYAQDNTPPENHEILVIEENSIDWRLFQADANDPGVPSLTKYLVAII